MSGKQQHLYSFQRILSTVLNYFEFQGAIFYCFYIFISGWNFNLIFMIIVDWWSHEFLTWFYDNNLFHRNYILSQWIKKFLIIPM